MRSHFLVGQCRQVRLLLAGAAGGLRLSLLPILHFVDQHLLHFAQSFFVTVARLVHLGRHVRHRRRLALLVGSPRGYLRAQRDLNQGVTLAAHLRRLVVID